MPEWINLHQAWAWIAFRDREKMASTKSPNVKAAVTLYHRDGSSRVKNEGFQSSRPDAELWTALKNGKLEAHQIRDTQPVKIDRMFWSHVPPWRAPEDALVAASRVMSIWPAKDRHTRSKYNLLEAERLWEDIRAENPDWSKGEQRRELRVRYERKFKAALPTEGVPEDTVKGWVRNFSNKLTHS